MSVRAPSIPRDSGPASAVSWRYNAASGLSLEEYKSRPMVRAAVEREFEIVGEALARLIKVDTAVEDRISDRRRIVPFRNILVHGYADVDDQLVWDVITTKLSTLQEEVNALLNPRL